MKDNNPRFICDGLHWKPMNIEARQALEAPCKKEEIQVTVFELWIIKLPRPDGTIRKFYKNSLNILKSDIIEVFHEFFKNGIINKRCN